MNTIASNNHSVERPAYTRSMAEYARFGIGSAVAVFLRYQLMAGCAVLLVWLAAAIWLGATGHSAGSWQAWRATPAARVASEVCGLWIAGLWILRSTHRRWPQYWAQAQALRGFGVTPRVPGRHVALGMLMGGMVVGMQILIDSWRLPQHAIEHHLFALARQSTPLARMMVATSAVTIVPLVEEVMFRGVLLTALLGYGLDPDTASPTPTPTRTVAAVALSSIIFGLMHGSAYAWHAWPLAWTGLDGVVMACVRLRSRSLWPGVALHATVNAIGSLSLLMAG